MELNLKIVGVLLVLLALFHAFFNNYFNWKEELKRISLINKQMMEVHTFFLAFFLLLIGVLCLFFSQELIETHLGKVISIGLAVFWIVRLFFQFFVYKCELWKGKRFETSMHILFTCIWMYFSSVFLWIGLNF